MKLFLSTLLAITLGQKAYVMGVSVDTSFALGPNGNIKVQSINYHNPTGSTLGGSYTFAFGQDGNVLGNIAGSQGFISGGSTNISDIVNSMMSAGSGASLEGQHSFTWNGQNNVNFGVSQGTMVGGATGSSGQFVLGIGGSAGGASGTAAGQVNAVGNIETAGELNGQVMGEINGNINGGVAGAVNGEISIEGNEKPIYVQPPTAEISPPVIVNVKPEVIVKPLEPIAIVTPMPTVKPQTTTTTSTTLNFVRPPVAIPQTVAPKYKLNMIRPPFGYPLMYGSPSQRGTIPDVKIIQKY